MNVGDRSRSTRLDSDSRNPSSSNRRFSELSRCFAVGLTWNVTLMSRQASDYSRHHEDGLRALQHKRIGRYNGCSWYSAVNEPASDYREGVSIYIR